MDVCVPIHAILCDGDRFDFFYFDGTTEPFSFKQGLDPNIPSIYKHSLHLPDPSYKSGICPFINVLRPVCETIFDLLLRGYVLSLKAYYKYIVTMNTKEDWPKKSVEEWEKAISAAVKTWQGFKDAEIKRQAQLTDEANSIVEEAVAALKDRYGISTFSCGNISNSNKVSIWFQFLTNHIWLWVIGMMLRLKKYESYIDFSQICSRQIALCKMMVIILKEMAHASGKRVRFMGEGVSKHARVPER